MPASLSAPNERTDAGSSPPASISVSSRTTCVALSGSLACMPRRAFMELTLQTPFATLSRTAYQKQNHNNARTFGGEEGT